MIRFATLVMAMACSGIVCGAERSASFGVGIDFSSGRYGGDINTQILSVPVSAQVKRGNWRFRASLPWLRVSGDPTVSLLLLPPPPSSCRRRAEPAQPRHRRPSPANPPAAELRALLPLPLPVSLPRLFVRGRRAARRTFGWLRLILKFDYLIDLSDSV